MAALACLAARPGEVVTREQLESTVWAGRVIGYDALSNTIAKLRKAFGDDPRHPRIIETIPKVGYRLIGEIRPSGQEHSPAPARAAVVAAALLFVGLLLWTRPPSPETGYVGEAELSTPDNSSIAVEPVASTTGRPEPDSGKRAEAREAFIKGREYYRRRTPHDFTVANNYLLRAVELDQDYAQAYATLAALYWETRSWWWSPALHLDNEAVRQRAIEFLGKAQAEPTVTGLITAARVHAKFGEYQAAISDARRAAALAPETEEPQVALAEVMVYAGQPNQALRHLTRPIPPNPSRRAYHVYVRGLAELSLEQYASATESLSEAVRLNTEHRVPAAALAAAYGLSNRKPQAASALDHYLGEYHGCYGTVGSTIGMFFPYRNDRDRERLEKGLRLAGMKERY